jgi:photosystem II stability/assembly factor-like uncharacterized protein
MEPLVCDIKPGQSLGLCKRARDTPVYFDEQAVEVVKETMHTDQTSDSNHQEQLIMTEETMAIDNDGVIWHTTDYGRTWSNTTASNDNQEA